VAGGAADCSFWIRKLCANAALHELQQGKRMSVARVSKILSDIMYECRGAGLSLGTMIAGFDDQEGSVPKIFYVDDSGTRIEGDLFAVGSGSNFALGILDTERHDELTQDQAIALGIKAIRHATFRDAYSGGLINVYLITRKDGWQHVFKEDLARLQEDAASLNASGE
jgi:20S proteasome subunit beta 5